ncbi:MAG: hypothetical protein V4671_25050 [Armatimonadota bacterium]
MDAENTSNPPAAIKQCPVCGRQYPPDFRFCQDDATPLTETGGAATWREPGNAPISFDHPVGISPRVQPDVPRSLKSGSQPGRTTAIVILLLTGVVLGGGGWMLMARTGSSGGGVPRDVGTPRAAPSSPPVAAAEAPAETVADDWQKFAQDDGGFTLHLPPGWKPVAPENRADIQRWQWRSPDDPDVTITADIDLTRRGQRAVAVWNDLDARFTKAFKGRYTRLGMGTGSLDGEPAAVWTFRIHRKGKPELTKIDYGVTLQSGQGFALMLSTPPDQIERWKPMFAQVVSRFGWYGD